MSGPIHDLVIHSSKLYLDHASLLFSSGSQTLILNSPVISTILFVNSTLTATYYINSVLNGTGTSSYSNTNAAMSIGNDSNSNYYTGDIAEILVFGSALSSNDRLLIETYLNAKYGIY